MAISLFRVDDRLVHGQVAEVWSRFLGANRIIVVDDFTAKDTFLTRIMVMMSPAGCKVEVYTAEDAFEPICRYAANAAIRCIVLFSTPIMAEELFRRGLSIPKLCIGGMQRRGDRKPFYKNHHASKEELAALCRMNDGGTAIYHKVVPVEEAVDLQGYIR
ncbi:MAG: PTS sugar transporter subunit IIB [Clostridiales bacterium]|nr:PTS sugar transporter subunit IIB [Clostridiales bacterium]